MEDGQTGPQFGHHNLPCFSSHRVLVSIFEAFILAFIVLAAQNHSGSIGRLKSIDSIDRKDLQVFQWHDGKNHSLLAGIVPRRQAHICLFTSQGQMVGHLSLQILADGLKWVNQQETSNCFLSNDPHPDISV